MLSTHNNEKFKVFQLRSQQILLFSTRSCPARGTEVFLKNVPRNIPITDILYFLEQCGEIYQIRLMMDFSGNNKDFCYASYTTKDAAKISTLVLSGFEIKPGFPVHIQMSFDNNKLVMKNIPWKMTDDQLMEELMPVVDDGLMSISWQSYDNKKSCVLEYMSHRHALEARKKIWPGVILWNTKIEVDWADPVITSKGKSIVFKNLPSSTTRLAICENLKEIIDINTVLQIQIKYGNGYITFVSEETRQAAIRTFQEKPLLGRKGVFVEKKLE
ncbi:probable RNA-binding protein 46 [Sitophilus oryzae]|uniref:Probable RNA-binding protein 46 n=1 Tax=Sitophilus oryzae TaxID=7048 RepID=A0A6J2Y6B4_SITOR|nr:probable RNA-binding protein 46 [Sitophilus oryzae]